MAIQEAQTTIEECQLGNSCFMGLEPPLQIIASLLHQCEAARHPRRCRWLQWLPRSPPSDLRDGDREEMRLDSVQKLRLEVWQVT